MYALREGSISSLYSRCETLTSQTVPISQCILPQHNIAKASRFRGTQRNIVAPRSSRFDKHAVHKETSRRRHRCQKGKPDRRTTTGRAPSPPRHAPLGFESNKPARIWACGGTTPGGKAAESKRKQTTFVARRPFRRRNIKRWQNMADNSNHLGCDRERPDLGKGGRCRTIYYRTVFPVNSAGDRPPGNTSRSSLSILVFFLPSATRFYRTVVAMSLSHPPHPAPGTNIL